MNQHRFAVSYEYAELARLYRENTPLFAHFAAGYGVIRHIERTQVRLYEKLLLLHAQGRIPSLEQAYALLAAADRIACAGMWLVVHATYARRVYTDGRGLEADDFKEHPEGHTGGSLNMVPAYVGYLLANALTGLTRSWMMGQGHCVSAIDATNVLVENMTPSHAARYSFSDEGLTKFVQDFYSYKLTPSGIPSSPLGSHVNPNTAGGILEGGFLGFAELQYVHTPLPQERLVAFLSDGAFEEQRGSDWAPRWWRAEDCGLVTPILIANGRRIEQRSLLAQEGGTGWLADYLRLHGFDPVEIDGRDPADIAWAILEMEERLEQAGHAAGQGLTSYPIKLPYGIAETIKGYGFPGAGTNLAHNLPLGKSPKTDEEARHQFNQGSRGLWVPLPELTSAVRLLNNHAFTGRPKEKDHACAKRNVSLHAQIEPPFQTELPSHQNETEVPSRQGQEEILSHKRASGKRFVKELSPMTGLDRYFCQLVAANPHLRVRVGNPDELRSNGMNETLDRLKHRVTQPEPSVAEAVDGSVITALNEEAVVCAALANKGGLNLVVTYEAFAPKMLGAVRQELLFARHQRLLDQSPGWLSVPLVLTSHTFENGKNEQSHQDPTMCEALLGEMSDGSRVLFPVDANSAIAALEAVYQTQGRIWTLVVPKRPVPSQFTKEQARELVQNGAILVRDESAVLGCGESAAQAKVLLIAVGAYQLLEALKASDRLREHSIPHRVISMIEPGRFREARDDMEGEAMVPKEVKEALFPSSSAVRIFFSHTRPHILRGVLEPLCTKSTKVLGYLNQGGTLDTAGMLFVNRCTWAHAMPSIASALSLSLDQLLTKEEREALEGRGDPTRLG